MASITDLHTITMAVGLVMLIVLLVLLFRQNVSPRIRPHAVG